MKEIIFITKMFGGHIKFRSALDTVLVARACSAAFLAVLVGFTSLQRLPCAPASATTQMGMLVTNG